MNSLKVRERFHAKAKSGSATIDTWQAQPEVQSQISELLIKKRPLRKEMRRHISLHVGSRWYRAPEICLVEKHYD